MWEALGGTYSPSLVTASLSTYKQIDNPDTRCPQRIFQVSGIKVLHLADFTILHVHCIGQEQRDITQKMNMTI